MVHASIPLDDPTATSRQHNALLPLITISSGPNAARAEQAEVLLMRCLCTAFLYYEERPTRRKKALLKQKAEQ